MSAAWVVIAVLLVGLPLAAWWVGGRSAFWSRAEARQVPDVHREMVRRHALRPAEAARVEAAVTWGRELEEPRLRAAVVDWAEARRAELVRWSLDHPRAAALRVWVLGLWATLTVAALVFAVVGNRWGDVPWVGAVWWCAGPVAGLFQRRALRRAVELNSDPVPPA
ncbi:hypothetical protein [Modestobacter versicolor]|uniref:hypothetical protein n=1 Tax=Modestobacter versicolor TaxID=429133 RepID=UPI0034DFF917